MSSLVVSPFGGLLVTILLLFVKVAVSFVLYKVFSFHFENKTGFMNFILWVAAIGIAFFI